MHTFITLSHSHIAEKLLLIPDATTTHLSKTIWVILGYRRSEIPIDENSVDGEPNVLAILTWRLVIL